MSGIPDEGDQGVTGPPLAGFGRDDTTPRPRLTRLIRPVLGWLGLIVVTIGGGIIGWQLTPATTGQLGPFTLGTQLVLTQEHSAVLDLPPVGRVGFDTHAGPVKVRLWIEAVDAAGAGALIEDPQALDQLLDEAPDRLRAMVTRAAVSSAGFVVAGSALAGALVYRRPRLVAACALLPVLAGGIAVTVAVTTFDPARVNQPQFTGLLSRAPYVAARGLDAVDRLQAYRGGVRDMVRAASLLYATTEQLPADPGGDDVTVLLHVSDIHLNPQAFDLIQALVAQFPVDAVIDTGDITTWGTTAESATLAPIGTLPVPYVFVRGNHDSAQTADAVRGFPNAVVLDGGGADVAGLRIVGVPDPTFSPDDGGYDPQAAHQAATALADAVTADEQAGHRVDIGLVHNPGDLDPARGLVPLILSGHLHRAEERFDADTGTRVMIEGSTGGAGVTSGALDRIAEGEPLPLTATLLYVGAPGTAEAGRLIAYDRVSVGGLGLASTSIERTVIPATAPAGEQATPTPGSPRTGPTGASAPPAAPVPAG